MFSHLFYFLWLSQNKNDLFGFYFWNVIIIVHHFSTFWALWFPDLENKSKIKSITPWDSLSVNNNLITIINLISYFIIIYHLLQKDNIWKFIYFTINNIICMRTCNFLGHLILQVKYYILTWVSVEYTNYHDIICDLLQWFKWNTLECKSVIMLFDRSRRYVPLIYLILYCL